MQEAVLTEHPDGKTTLHRARVLRNAEGRHYAITFADHADVLVEIDQAARAHADYGRAAQAEAARVRSITTAPTVSPATSGPAQSASSGPERTHRTR